MKTRKKKNLGQKRNDNPNKKGNSIYARKRAYLNKHGGFGFDYPDKPWKQ
jgi:hypothetical protein